MACCLAMGGAPPAAAAEASLGNAIASRRSEVYFVTSDNFYKLSITSAAQSGRGKLLFDCVEQVNTRNAKPCWGDLDVGNGELNVFVISTDISRSCNLRADMKFQIATLTNPSGVPTWRARMKYAPSCTVIACETGGCRTSDTAFANFGQVVIGRELATNIYRSLPKRR